VDEQHKLDSIPQPVATGKAQQDVDVEAKAAFFNGADPSLTPEEQDAMWEEAKSFIFFKINQRKGKA
jgi:hypothetical protein